MKTEKLKNRARRVYIVNKNNIILAKVDARTGVVKGEVMLAKQKTNVLLRLKQVKTSTYIQNI